MSFRVWASGKRRVALVLEGRVVELDDEGNGYFSAVVDASAGQRYGFKLDDEDAVHPDIASRFQPDGPDGLSEIADASRYEWKHDHWPLPAPRERVLYEMHAGTFTPEGTWRSAIRQLPRLRDLGVTLLEVMPAPEFPGDFGWGYDGVFWFAPYRGYGHPDDFRAFVDAAHGLGMGVILDVVYNHVGPDGNHMPAYSDSYFSKKYKNEWGDPLNFDGEHAQGMRDLVVDNVRYWVEAFRVDGFRYDAVQQIFDASPEHIVALATRRAREAAGAREILVFAEDEPQHARLVRPAAEQGYALDGIWNDDFHHSAVVALTGRRSAYFSDYEGSARELASCARHGFLFQGQHYTWQRKTRGEDARDVAPHQFVCYLENHDQVANRCFGRRLHQMASAGAYRAMTALLLLGPWTPLLFQGQEFGSTRPFLYFADHREGLRDEVAKGRREFVSQFRNMRDPEVQVRDPHERAVFEASTLDPAEAETHTAVTALHRDLIRLRREDAVMTSPDRRDDASPIADDCLLVRFDAAGAARALVVNLGNTIEMSSVSDPLVAPPGGLPWRILWHSERPLYGGSGMPPLEPLRWEIPGQSAVLLST